ncbi:MAG: carbamoyltransferase HypF, partial [Leptothrix sp. (in: b-proteobacteria)]
DEIARRFADQPASAGLLQLLDRGLRCPTTSSLGRVFDAAAGLLGLSMVMRTEAEAAIALEQAAVRHGPCAPLAGGWQVDADGQLDLRPLLAQLADEADAGRGAALFHATLAAALADWLVAAARRSGIRQVAAGGGCLANRVLALDLRRHCAAADLQLFEARHLLPGDSAIAFGQAIVARHTLERN